MDPATMAMIATMIASTVGAATQKGGLFGSKEKHGSSYGKGAQDILSQIQKFAEGGFQNGDITQNQGYQQGQEWLNNLYNDPDFFNKFEAPIQRQFQEQTIPDLLNKYASMGSGGNLSSGGLQRQLAREAGNLHTNIAAQRGNMQQQGVNQGLQYAQQPVANWQQLLQQALTPTQNTYQGASTGLIGGAAPGMFSGLAQGVGQQWGQNMANPNQPQQQSPMGQSPQSPSYSGMGNSSSPYGLPDFNPNYRTTGQARW